MPASQSAEWRCVPTSRPSKQALAPEISCKRRMTRSVGQDGMLCFGASSKRTAEMHVSIGGQGREEHHQGVGSGTCGKRIEWVSGAMPNRHHCIGIGQMLQQFSPGQGRKFARIVIACTELSRSASSRSIKQGLMPMYHRLGIFPTKKHTVFKKSDGNLHYEQLFGTEGFSGMSSLLYHLNRPTMVGKLGRPSIGR